jgi:EamA domain-containing membrane protein RarD
MTELPPTGPDELDDPWHDQIVEVTDDYGAPDVQALVSIVLAVASLCGFGLLNGSYYFLQYIQPADAQKTRVVLSALLGAAFALLPIWLGWRAGARVLTSDPRWVAAVARAAVVLGLISLVLRLVIAVIAAGTDEPSGFGRF